MVVDFYLRILICVLIAQILEVMRNLIMIELVARKIIIIITVV